MDRKTRIAVIGAGLGGLTVAGFLQRSGFAVNIYEQAPEFSRMCTRTWSRHSCSKVRCSTPKANAPPAIS